MTVLTKENYADSVSSGIVVVDVGAGWCPDCRRIEPIMKTLEEEYKDVRFFAVDFSKEEALKDELDIKRIPTLIFYKDGKEVASRLVEPGSRAEIEKELKRAMEA